MGEVFKGTEAVAGGQLTEYALRRWHQRIFRDVYLPKRQEVSIRDRAAGAWLSSQRRGVVAGVAASALQGAEWVDPNVDIELVLCWPRPRPGIIARNETLLDGEVTSIGGVPVTTVARTAFDLGRFQTRLRALQRLDALMRATPFSIEDVLLIAKHHKGARGVRKLKELLPLVDGGAASPKETWLRLLYIDAGFPKPTTQIPVYDEWGLIGYLDMGWENFKVGSEYDGDQHRTNRLQYVKDLRRIPRCQRQGWHHIRVIKEDFDSEIINRTRSALVSRGWKP